MPLPLQYSIQHSSLKPKGVTGEYVRLQVSLRTEQRKIIISNEDYSMLIQALSEGRLVGFCNESGVKLGQFQTSLSGGTVAKEFTSPEVSDIRISFKPSQRFLSSVRSKISFEQIPTVTRNPIITSTSFTYIDDTQITLNNQIKLNTSGILKLRGSNFIKNGMKTSISQDASNTWFSNAVNSGTKYIDIIVNSNDISSADGFTAGQSTVTVCRVDNLRRCNVIPIKIIA